MGGAYKSEKLPFYSTLLILYDMATLNTDLLPWASDTDLKEVLVELLSWVSIVFRD